MKRVYNKPMIIYENFELSMSIAGNCEAIANHIEGACSVSPKDLLDMGIRINIFNNISICDDADPTGHNQFCYHAPTEGNNVFSS